MLFDTKAFANKCLMQEVFSIRETLFFCFAGLLVISALGVVVHRNPVKSAMFLVSFFVGLAAMYALLGADFLSTMQVLVYVGAIMVLFLFVIMLLAVREENFEGLGTSMGKSTIAAIIALAFIVQASLLLKINPVHSEVNTVTPYSQGLPGTGKSIEGNVEVLSMVLFQEYLLPFELVALLLLVATIGAIVLAKKNRRELQ